MDKFGRLKTTRICQRCGTPFHPWKGKKQPGLFCSVACREPPAIERFWANVDKTPGHGPQGECWIWTASRDKDGYGQFGDTRAHRFSWTIHFGPIPEGKWVLHRCDNPPCVRPDHLFLGTSEDNCADRDAKGRTLYGSGHGMAIVNEDLVREIRARYKQGGISQTALGIEYGLAQTSISQIILYHCWKHVA